MHLVAPEIGILGTVPIVAATVPLAVGAALASKIRRDGSVSVAFFGDGTLEEGHVQESMNLAALYALPVVFVCENNLYASHLHLSQRRVSDRLSQAGEFQGVRGRSTDGNDVDAVYRAAVDAVEAARNGEGPSFLEFRTFRWRGHVGASSDMDVGVKRKDELKDWLPRDPIALARQALQKLGSSDQDLRSLEAEISEEIESAIRFAKSSPLPLAEDVMMHVFSKS
jgi:pyruvate dehydrogenase E1 component alpha subunit